MKVEEVMSSPVVTIDYRGSITEAAEKMKLLNVGVLPVTRNGNIIGMVTDRDIVVRAIAGKMNPGKTIVSKAMTCEVIYCSEDMEIDEAVRLMEGKKIHRLLVLSRDNSLAGVLSVGDIAMKINDGYILHELLRSICEQAHTF